MCIVCCELANGLRAFSLLYIITHSPCFLTFLVVVLLLLLASSTRTIKDEPKAAADKKGNHDEKND